MTHQEKRKSFASETVYGLISGGFYGSCLVLAGHPLDTIKTRIQTQYSNIYTHKNLYKGVFPNMMGSMLYRSLQFAVFEGLYTKFQKTQQFQTDTGLLGLKQSTILSGIIASGARALIESPVEYVKVHKQMNTQPIYTLKNLYTGFTHQYIRTTGLMTTYFCTVDILRRNTSLFDSLTGQFVASAGAATLGYWIVWPFEVLKNNRQLGINKKIRGIQLYRGILPGTIYVFWANGLAMMAMQVIQKLLHR